MPKPISRRELIRKLRTAGFSGPEAGGNHAAMRDDSGRKVPIPNPHGGDIDWKLTKRIIAQAGLTPEEWKNL